MIWTSRFLFLDSQTTMCLALSDVIVDKSIDTVYLTDQNGTGDAGRVIRFKAGTCEHLLEAEAFFNKKNKSILDFEKIFVCMRNPYGLELARYQSVLDNYSAEADSAQKIAMNGSFIDFLEYAPLKNRLPPRLDRYFEVLGKAPDKLVILRYESIREDLRQHLGPYLTDMDFKLDISDDNGAIARIYDAEAEAHCYRRNRWFFDKGYYSRLAIDSKLNSAAIGPFTIIYLLGCDRDSTALQVSIATSLVDKSSCTPAVTIVMVYQSNAIFLRQTLVSLYKQSFTDWELLLVDDGSVDGSQRLVEELVALDHRVHRLQHEGGGHHGEGASCNLSYQHARGEFVTKLNPDGVYASHTALAEQVALMLANPEIAMICGASEFFGATPSNSNTSPSSLPVDEVASPPRLTQNFIEHCIEEPYSRLMRLSAVKAVGGCDPLFLQKGADFSLPFKLALRFPVLVSSKYWHKPWMQQQLSSLSSYGHFRSEEESLQLYQWVDKYLKNDQVLGSVKRIEFRLSLLRSRIAWKFRWRHEVRTWLRAQREHWEYSMRENSKWYLCCSQVAALRLWHRLTGGAIGNMGVTSKVIWLESVPTNQNPAVAVELHWAAKGTERIDVRLGASNGNFVFRNASIEDSKKTGPWVEDRAWFFLQNAGANNPGSLSATLDVLQVRVRVKRTHQA